MSRNGRKAVSVTQTIQEKIPLPNIEYRGHVTLPVTNNHAVKSRNCDCSIDGDGSADKPLFIRYCVAHSAGYGLFALWEDKQAKK